MTRTATVCSMVVSPIKIMTHKLTNMYSVCVLVARIRYDASL